MNVLINGLQSKVGGGKTILYNLLKVIYQIKVNDRFIVLTPNYQEYKIFNNSRINVLDLPNCYNNKLFFLYVNHYLFPKIVQKNNIDVVLNLSDIPIPINISQVYLFDWPYAIYLSSIIWKKMNIKSFIYRKIKLFFLKKYINHADIVIAQTEVVKERLNKYYNLFNVKVIPTAISLNEKIDDQVTNAKFNLPSGIKLLYLTHYYPHKNIEIFIPLAKEIKKNGFNYKIITTISPDQHIHAKKFLCKIKKEGLEDIIYNIGSVDVELTISLYKQCDALLMPTLLESYGLPYFEAMRFGLTILTSNMDFAKVSCGDAAFYFEPLDHYSILNTINYAFNESNIRLKKIELGKSKFSKISCWEDMFNSYYSLLSSCKYIDK